ncbi:hypothetical protein GCM10023142_31180 [Anaerocolumna aminovalerica]|uniref:Uncharacterized protein n=1 Tax=Anaerocolumna aminovalerica TaxID=1527 RepID=A0A1I5EP73_9FIRM|nr:hypothetical protein [Anaerocolumna aminovalerica]SFO13287.1 hypothetical protein SAMN04489757_11058 [Anaerocolumna aminovalerica]
MIYLEFYDPTKTYVFQNLVVATPDLIQVNYPAIANPDLKCVIMTDATHTVFKGYGILSNYIDEYHIDVAGKEDEDILKEIEYKMNEPLPVPKPTAEDRIAAALEYQNLLSM